MRRQKKVFKLIFKTKNLLLTFFILSFLFISAIKLISEHKSKFLPFWNNSYIDSMITSKAWNNNGNAICTSPGSQTQAQICSDGAGGAIITWQDSRSGNYAIYAQRITSAGNIQWTLNGVVICNASDNRWVPQICSDGAGGAIITWEDSRTGSRDIYAQRINSAGNVQWTLNGTVISNASSSQTDPQICSDGAGGAIIT
ncbi:MAG: hypothetical protein ACFFCM_17000, partial [Promethearchaeota archaeon]